MDKTYSAHLNDVSFTGGGRSRGIFSVLAGTILPVLVAATPAWAEHHAAPVQCAPSFVEEFDGPLNESLWNVIEGNGCDIGLCGWGNNEAQSYSRDSLVVEDGLLKITARQSDEQILSGKLTTANHFAQRYGRFEARIKVPAMRGAWPAFWLMPDQPEKGWPLEGEIDILEWTGNEPHRLITAAHFGDLPPGNVHSSETLLRPWDWSEDFHIYRLDWAPGELHWSVDGRRHATLKPEDIGEWPWRFDDKAFYIILNLAVGGTLGGEITTEDMPATMLIDWVRVYPEQCAP